jgi:cytochrome c biogenesis protein CcmG/thiol:disulfide interchange protein DsbE
MPMPKKSMKRTSSLGRFAAVGLALTLLAASAQALDAGAKMPEIGLSDLSGKPVSLASLAGKVVVIDFWATWCAPCKEELPVLQKLHKKYGSQGLVIVGVSVDKDAANLPDFLKKLVVTFPIVHDANHAVTGRYAPPRMPSSYIVDRKGIVKYVHGGFRADDAAVFEKQIQGLLAAK